MTGVQTCALPICINDMFCTSSNVVGDTAVNTIVAKTEGEIGKEEGVDAEPAQANA